ncbi:hypothetical protein THICB1_170010 [Thiomonas arsenitoxydans]|uniref:Transposase n=3 Tax=Burkholderiales genera incertae sedis TaxID=224471 RepID=A0A238D7F8_THIDL|nr:MULTISPECIES: hypothetical protein [Thiomonas]CDW96145.1 hypothetical protein THICB2_740016 [Thiomonas sp. CB2]CQR42499.1 hypothetical protein THICB3270021 [Thiomonas sp. CB3]VDY06891.1 protein of unknown function [Thiomonas sp. Bio17B3]VDY09813.1 protein of unknown function [Thiomonas sp. Sup16B3]VDY15166.1 conserved protein of unknown function [Thiomonas sp. OC7]
MAELQVELIVMESTGIYWKSVYAHLENVGITAWVVILDSLEARNRQAIDGKLCVASLPEAPRHAICPRRSCRPCNPELQLFMGG